MTRKLIVLCVSMALELSPSAVAPQDTDLELAEGIRLTKDESYVSAVITLDKVVRRLAPDSTSLLRTWASERIRERRPRSWRH